MFCTHRENVRLTLNLLFADKVIQEISYDKVPYSTHSGTHHSQHWGIGVVAFIGEMNGRFIGLAHKRCYGRNHR